MKRDDLTGFAGGGNKARKLEYLIGEALAKGADAVVTCGAAQSNFVRQLGAACSVSGLSCHAVVMNLPFDPPAGLPPTPVLSPRIGNPQLNEHFGVHVEVVPDGSWEDLYDAAEQTALRLEQQGKRAYRIPIGGSSALGVFAFIQAAGELTEAFDTVVTASSSGSTQVGLSMGLPRAQVVGMACDPEPEIVHDFAELSVLAATQFSGLSPLTAEQFHMDFNGVGEGYGVPSDQGQEALRWLARTEGILLDPVYSAKAFGAMLLGIREQRYQGRILFWHTGGVPTLFALPG